MEKKLILDYSTWRCGGEGKNKLGEGRTALLNYEGFMCCLGQFSLQLGSEITERDLDDEAEPSDMWKLIPYLTIPNENGEEEFGYYNTQLSNRAMKINDDEKTSVTEKIEQLKELFKEEEFEIEVINQPS